MFNKHEKTEQKKNDRKDVVSTQFSQINVSFCCTREREKKKIKRTGQIKREEVNHAAI